MKIKLTAWEIAQAEAALRQRVDWLKANGADEDAIHQTHSLYRRLSVARDVTIGLVTDPAQ